MLDVAHKWPLDFESLSKGDVITEPVCREIIKPKTEDAYQLGLLGLKQDIERNLLLRGLVVTVKITRKTIHILTDAEASEYNEARQQQAIKSFIGSQRRLLGVDTTRLTTEQVVEHDRRLTNGATYLTALSDARKSINGRIETPPDDRPKLF